MDRHRANAARRRAAARLRHGPARAAVDSASLAGDCSCRCLHRRRERAPARARETRLSRPASADDRVVHDGALRGCSRRGRPDAAAQALAGPFARRGARDLGTSRPAGGTALAAADPLAWLSGRAATPPSPKPVAEPACLAHHPVHGAAIGAGLLRLRLAGADPARARARRRHCGRRRLDVGDDAGGCLSPRPSSRGSRPGPACDQCRLERARGRGAARPAVRAAVVGLVLGGSAGRRARRADRGRSDGDRAARPRFACRRATVGHGAMRRLPARRRRPAACRPDPWLDRRLRVERGSLRASGRGSGGRALHV